MQYTIIVYFSTTAKEHITPRFVMHSSTNFQKNKLCWYKNHQKTINSTKKISSYDKDMMVDLKNDALRGKQFILGQIIDY